MINVKSSKEIELMRIAARLTGETLNLLKEHIKPGISTAELDRIAENYLKKNNATPTFKGYGGFPGSVCASVNEQVIHGIPSKKVILKEGDIISLDFGACYKGYNGDAARTYPVGKISEDAEKLIKVTEESFFKGLEFCKPGCRISDISHAIQEYAEKFGYGVVREYVGHGVGRELHESPEIPNYGNPGRGPRLVNGMTIAVEPMINMGDYRVRTLSNEWTVVTLDGCLSAHYENTILITKGEPEVLTLV